MVDNFAPIWLNNTLPGWGDDGPSISGNRLERECYRYKSNWTSVDQCLAGNELIDKKAIEKCDRWVYDTSTFRSTIFTEVIVQYY